MAMVVPQDRSSQGHVIGTSARMGLANQKVTFIGVISYIFSGVVISILEIKKVTEVHKVQICQPRVIICYTLQCCGLNLSNY